MREQKCSEYGRFTHVPFTQPTAHPGYTIHCQPYEESFLSAPSIDVMGGRIFILPVNKEFLRSGGLDKDLPRCDLGVGIQRAEGMSDEHS